MPTLLVSLGTSPAIVPEAFLLPGVAFDAVHVLTTESTRVEFVLDWFAAEAPGVALSISRVAGFTDFKTEREHFLFEEALYRWWLEMCPRSGEAHGQGQGQEPPHVCLSGGFKTMSAAVQKAAAVLGAAEVFHVLADAVYDDPKKPGIRMPAGTAEQIAHSLEHGHLHWIRLGAESGWPQFRQDQAGDFPLTVESVEGVIRRVSAPDSAFRERLAEIVTRSHNIAGAWDQLGSLPFPILATWTGAQLDWLRQPVDPQNAADRDWVADLPKIELHCHLGGFATHGDSLRQVRAAAAFSETLPTADEPALPADWPLPVTPAPLDAYMSFGNANGSKLLKDPGCLREQCRLLYRHLLQQKIVYAEIRCSPNNYATTDGFSSSSSSSPGNSSSAHGTKPNAAPRRSAWDVLGDIREVFQQCMEDEPGCEVNLIIIATRKDGGDRSDISRHLALAITAAQHWTSGCRVVGVDLAGFENKDTRAALFATDFEPVHRVGLAVTVHAGENDDAEGIWQAVFKLNARRLGHALHLNAAPDLRRAVAERRIGVEMCPYANLQIKGFPLPSGATFPDRHPGSHPSFDSSSYPLAAYLRKGIPVTVNTDNIGISAASLTDNLLLAARLCPGLTRLDLLQLQANSLATAFLTPAAREALRARMESLLAVP